nr:hypothetical protein OG999_02250 [Streptomyces sp. NBC_00886]
MANEIPEATRASATACAAGRSAGAPASSSTADPAAPPTASAAKPSSGTIAAAATLSTPHTVVRNHSARRGRAPSHGPAATTAAAQAAR